jgi:AAA domain-containing protein
MRAGADLAKIALWRGPPPTFPSQAERMEGWIREHRPAALIVDPLTEMMDPGLNPGRDRDVRLALSPLALIGDAYRCAVVATAHPNKSVSQKALYRMAGSLGGFVGRVRSLLVIGRQPGAAPSDPTRLLAHVKTNYGLLAPSIRLVIRVAPDEDHPSVAWAGETDATADQVMGASASHEDKLAGAVAFLELALEDGEWHPSEEVKKEAYKVGVRPRTLQRAAARLGLEYDRPRDAAEDLLEALRGRRPGAPGAEGVSRMASPLSSRAMPLASPWRD